MIPAAEKPDRDRPETEPSPTLINRRTSSLDPPTRRDRPNATPPPPLRVIVDTDAANEADDQFAVAHALLSPTLDVRGVVAAHFGTRRSDTSLADSRAELELIMELMGDSTTPLADGQPGWLVDETTPIDSPGAQLIIQESHGDGPLWIGVLGPLSTVASAVLLDPGIVDRDVTVVWIGGPPYDGLLGRVGGNRGIEFNLSNDIHAANVVLGSGLHVIQVPQSTYTLCSVGYPELRAKVAPHGRLGAYLYEQLVRWNDTWNTTAIERRSLGDSPAIGLMLGAGAVLRERPAPRFARDGSMVDGPPGRTVTVCESIDTRYLFEDLFAKLAEFGAEG